MPRKSALALLALVCLAVAGDGTAQRRAFEERVAVREVELVFERPDLPRLRFGTFGPEDLIVTEDGLVRPVTKVGSIEDATVRSWLRREEAIDVPPWTAVVWIDRTLAAPETVFLATLSLAQNAEDLARLGPVEVVVADPAIAVVAGATREPRRLEQVLSEVAGEARIERDRAAGSQEAAAPPPPDAEALRRQLDRLLVHLAGRTAAGPKLLFLVAGGFGVSPTEARAYETGRIAPDSGARAEEILETSRLLAGYGWVTVVLPMSKGGLGKEDRSPSDVDRFRTDTGNWGSTNNSVPPVIPPKAPRDSRLKWDAILDSAIRLDLSPLRALAGPTGGTLVPREEVLPATLTALGARWHLYYQTQMPLDGRLRPVSVRLRTGATVRTRQWVRSSTPDGIAEARLRRLLAGEELPGTLPLDTAVEENGLRMTVGAFLAPEPAVAGPVRVTVACEASGGPPVFRHELLPGIDAPAQGWSGEVSPSSCSRPLAVLVEDLARERWQAVRLHVQ